MTDDKKKDDKNPHAVALGARGGKAGGQARAAKLTAARRSQIAAQAARARWGTEKPPKKKRRNTEPNDKEVYRRILTAAHKEFTEVGLAGARVDRIAELAGVNKRMLYHYFGSKENLFWEMLRRNLLELAEAETRAPQNLAEELIYWRDLLQANSDWVRLTLWESLAYDSENIIGEKERRAFWKKGVAQLKHQQTSGNIAPALDAELLQLYLFAIAAFPLILPQITKLITGQSPIDPEFLQRQAIFLRDFAERLKS